MSKIHYDNAWTAYYGKPLDESLFWVKKCRIPLGTLQPYESYEGEIPMEDIVTITFDPKGTPFTARKALNILELAGSGDGKSQIMKIIWDVLQQAGFFILYIDPKSTDSGRASVKWDGSPRPPPYMIPHGIPLAHYIPVWATNDMEHLVHNFRICSDRLHSIYERDMWMGLGMTNIAASKTAKIIERIGKGISVKRLRDETYQMDKEEISPQSFNNLMSTLVDVEDYHVVDDKVPELNMWKVWTQEKKSVCISYNAASTILMTFHVGLKIKQAARYYVEHHNHTPIMVMLDDAPFYDDIFPNVKFNFSLSETIKIGFQYRSLGVNNTLATQSLKVIDEKIADTYRIKLISPYFQDIDSLSKINIPKKAIQYLRENVLIKDKQKHLTQWLLINEDNEVIPFFPFTPVNNHFREIYFPKQEKKIIEGDADEG